MTAIEMVQVLDSGERGDQLATAVSAAGGVSYRGVRPAMLQRMIEGIAERYGVGPSQVLINIARDGWSNGKLMIGAPE